MSDTKKILVVDDQFEVLEFLRSMLQLANSSYQVRGVPSAEEGLLELRLGHYDLLITDLKLPGMSGFDLARKARQTDANIPIIMITAYSPSIGPDEAGDLDIFRYFIKPLDTDGLLAAVHQALSGERSEARPVVSQRRLFQAEVAPRLRSLAADTSAVRVVLAGMDGEISYDSGGSEPALIEALMKTVARAVAGSFQVGSMLGSDRPFTIQYQAGIRHEIYSANVGKDYVLTLFFEAAARRGRIGTVWVFAQRAIRDILPLLDALPEAAEAKETETQLEQDAQETILHPRQQEAQAPATGTEPVVWERGASDDGEEEVIEPDSEIEDTAAAIDNAENEEMLTEAAGADIGEWGEELEGLLEVDFSELESAEPQVDQFWEEAIEESEKTVTGEGLSWEEAVRQGLISENLEVDE